MCLLSVGLGVVAVADLLGQVLGQVADAPGGVFGSGEHALGVEPGHTASSRQISTAHNGAQTEYALLAMLPPGGPSSQRPAPGRIIEDTQRRAKHGRLR
jgi:hypothetical protein